MSNITKKTKDYSGFIQDLKDLIQSAHFKANQALHQIRLETYWQMGKRINKIKSALSLSDQKLLARSVAKDLNLSVDLVYRISKFQSLYTLKQIKNKNFQVSWAHHVELLKIPNAKAREEYLQEIQQNSWSRNTLRKAIKNQSLETQRSSKSQSLIRDLNPLYVYKAIVEKVVDGDTLVARIDLGFHTWSEQRIRLHNINTKELNSPNADDLAKAKSAKAFVEQRLKSVEFVVLKTFKTDMYGRFVADVFYHPTLTNKVQIAKEGFFLNQDLVDEGLAEIV